MESAPAKECMAKPAKKRLLVFNCHEAWVHQLVTLPYDLDIIVGLSGHHHPSWDYHIRPIPPNGQLISLEEACSGSQAYNAIIAHNPRDLLDIRHRTDPCILVLHLPLSARAALENTQMSWASALAILHEYIQLKGVHVVAVSELKGRSWGYADPIIPFGIDPNAYPDHQGSEARGIRIANFINQRKSFLNWDFHVRTFHDLPITLVGHNPDMNQVSPSRDWNHLKELLKSHRFYIHTADPVMEDGYNMATVEAMAAGLPVLGNNHPSSPVIHGVNGFLSDDPQVLRAYAQTLLADPVLAHVMGQAARKTAVQRFSPRAFRQNMEMAIRMAHEKHQDSIHAPVAPIPNRSAPTLDVRAIQTVKRRRRSSAAIPRKVNEV